MVNRQKEKEKLQTGAATNIYILSFFKDLVYENRGEKWPSRAEPNRNLAFFFTYKLSKIQRCSIC